MHNLVKRLDNIEDGHFTLAIETSTLVASNIKERTWIMSVYVLNKHGEPLMPCSERKARILLRDKKAVVKARTPFTIQMLYWCGKETQPITLGVDTGSKTIGVSASTDKKELYASEVIIRNDIVDLLSSRRAFRRARRNRKTRYRKPRFLNRSKADNIAPSIRCKINSHLKIIRDIHKILPITQIIAEVASFDIQKIKNPDISNSEYQQGEQLGFWNTREYVLFRDNHKCQYCKGKSGDKILNVHHIETRKTGGNAPNNLVTLCETCHNNYHKGVISDLKIKRGVSFRDVAFMGIMRKAFYNELKNSYDNVSLTYGYLTKNKRISHNLKKTHAIDAYCIANNLNAEQSNIVYMQKFVRTKNRQLHKANPKKGVRRKSQAPKYVFGYQIFDKVLFGKTECFIYGRRTSGYFDLRLLDGTKVHAITSYKKLKLLETRQSILTERSTRIGIDSASGM